MIEEPSLAPRIGAAPPAGNQSSGTSSLLLNGLYNVSGQTVRGAASLLTIPFLIRYLGMREYGVWSLGYAVFALMSMSEAGISVAATVFLSKDLAKNEIRDVSSTLTFILISALLLSGAVGLLLWLAGPLIVRPLGAFGSVERADAGRALQIAGLAVSFFILQRAMVGIEQAFDRYVAINVLELLQSLLTNIGLVVVAWLGGRTVAMMKWQLLVCAMLLAAHCGLAFRLLYSRGLKLAWSKNKAGRIFRYSMATWTATLGSAAFGQCDRFVVGGVLGAPALGVYSAITNITSRINSFSGTAVQPLVPSLSRDAGVNTSSEGRIRQAVQLNAFIAIQAGILLYVLADWVMRVMVPGALAPQDVWGLRIGAIIYALYSLNAPGYYILFSVGEEHTNAIVVLCSGMVALALILMGARYFGLLGALAGNAGYFGTWWLTVVGMRRTGIAASSYLSWMRVPFLCIAVALAAGALLAGHSQWATVFVVIQTAVFMLWFFREHGKEQWTDFGRTMVRVFTNNP